MAIVQRKPDEELPIVTTTPNTTPEPNKSIFTTLIPDTKVVSLLKHIEGFPWTTNWYGQILNENNTLEHFDPSSPNFTQPFYKINGLVLRVDSPISSSYNQADGVTLITGTSIVPYGVKPNVGDVFTAQVDSGEDAIFIVTSVTRKTHRKDTLYDISYSLYEYVSGVNPTLVQLESRVNDTYYFNDSPTATNREVLIRPEVKFASDALERLVVESKQYYFSTFVRRQVSGVIVPGIVGVFYDPLLNDFLIKTVEYEHLLNVRTHKHNEEVLEEPSIYDMLLSVSTAQAKHINKRYAFIESGQISNSRRLGTMLFTGVDYLLYPVAHDTRLSVKLESAYPTRSMFVNDIRTEKNYSDMSSLEVEVSANNASVFTKKLLPEMFKDDYYVVTEHFYNNLLANTDAAEISFFEMMLIKFLKREAIAKEDLLVIMQSYSKWSLLHQQYLLPVIWLMIRTHIN